MIKINKKCLAALMSVALLGVVFLFGTFFVSSLWIGNSVREKCEVAKASYGKDCVESLMMTFEDEENSYRERNRAVWALGQIGDRRALEVIYKYYTGEIPEREPVNEKLSQYEMKKAIKWMSGGFNLSALVWRNNLIK